ncbi:MAG TPA: hypothetical protein VGI10_14255 [Polyangiaceae bacterium]
MSTSIVIHDEAEAELIAAVEWYEARRRGLGGELLGEVARSIDAVREGFGGSPYLTTSGGDVSRRVFVDRFPYAIVFVVEAQYVHIMAFAHLRRRPGYWLARR